MTYCGRVTGGLGSSGCRVGYCLGIVGFRGGVDTNETCCGDGLPVVGTVCICECTDTKGDGDMSCC